MSEKVEGRPDQDRRCRLVPAGGPGPQYQTQPLRVPDRNGGSLDAA
jgi:hypothetical protein